MSATLHQPTGKAVVGLISDTHGTLHERAYAALQGVDAIVHAGDVCAERVLWELEAIAPVTAVAGNCDDHIGMAKLPSIASVEVAGIRVFAIHDLTDLDGLPDGMDVVVCGHTHRPREEWHGRVLVVNPGSASQRRSMPHCSVARLEIAPEGLTYRLVPLVG